MKPSEGQHIRKATKADMWKDPSKSTEGVYKVDAAWFESLPQWSWHDLFVYGKHSPEGYKLSGRQGASIIRTAIDSQAQQFPQKPAGPFMDEVPSAPASPLARGMVPLPPMP